MDEYIVRNISKAYGIGLDHRMPKIDAVWEKVCDDSSYHAINPSLTLFAYSFTGTIDFKKKWKSIKDMSSLRQHSIIINIIKTKIQTSKRLKDLSLILVYDLRPHDLSLHYHGILRDQNPSNTEYFVKYFRKTFGFAKIYQCYDRNENYTVAKWRKYMDDKLKTFTTLPLVIV